MKFLPFDYLTQWIEVEEARDRWKRRCQTLASRKYNHQPGLLQQMVADDASDCLGLWQLLIVTFVSRLKVFHLRFLNYGIWWRDYITNRNSSGDHFGLWANT